MQLINMYRNAFLAAGLGLGALAAGQATLAPAIENLQGPAVWKRANFHVPLATTAPKIDGKLDDLCWKDALHSEAFYRWQSTEPIHEQTEVWMCADKQHLYIAFHCLDSRPELIKAIET